MKCPGFLNVDCGKCVNCLDKKKFGGPGRKKKACVHKTCSGSVSNTSEVSHVLHCVKCACIIYNLVFSL